MNTTTAPAVTTAPAPAAAGAEAAGPGAVPDLLARPHLVGVAEPGMQGLALWLAGGGATVTGTVPDRLADSPEVAALRAAGVHVDVGHDAAHLPTGASAVVWSGVVAESQPELDRAQKLGLPVLGRAEALTEIAAAAGARTVAVGGSHNTATAAAALAVALGDSAGFILTAAPRGGRAGRAAASPGTGRLVVDFCPDAGTHEATPPFGWQGRPRPHFVRHRPEPAVALILTAAENQPHFEDNPAGLDAAERLATVAERVVLPLWDTGAVNLKARLADRAERGLPSPFAYTVGRDRGADVWVMPIEWTGTAHRVTIRHGGTDHTYLLPVPGRSHALAVCAAIATALVMDEDPAAVAERLAGFHSVERSLAPLGTEKGISVVDSRARHPEEIAADLADAVRTAAATGGSVVAVLEPDGLARTRAHGTKIGRALQGAGSVLLLPVHTPLTLVLDVTDPLAAIERAAREKLGKGAVRRLRSGPREPGFEQQIAAFAAPGDLVLLIGPDHGVAARLGARMLFHLAAPTAPVPHQL
ncbi:Mur ligase domain-containing protein [Kitasatospora sp. NRRL B-11411]|uniref:Mur ligase domain-containing protein n=1 Tax=Kitasatospora sp. NRRL B-11411 TaxID=1463822 RepID=UPI0004C41FB2|nr:Mur ligase domain-containing protein [Kitasatospora sp. NRRL B-11411]